MQEIPFSVLLPVCGKERPEWLDACLHSLFYQTVLPLEVLLVEDGILPAGLAAVVEKYRVRYRETLRILRLFGGMGLGEVLRRGVLECRCPLIARMDADDICVPMRFEKQLQVMENCPQFDIIGSNMLESRRSGVVCRHVPERQNEISSYSRWRNPFCHMTVMFRKIAVLRAGNYRAFPFFEDYDLWIRMLGNGSMAYNIQQNLVYARADDLKNERRGGIGYLRAEAAFLAHLFRSGYIGPAEWALSLMIRGAVRLLSAPARDWVYLHGLRRKSGGDIDDPGTASDRLLCRG